jgi:hypothetical protein
MTLFDIVGELLDLFRSWRLYLCVVPVLLGAYFLHEGYPGVTWTWFVSVPATIIAFCAGLYWEWRVNAD